MQPEWKRTLNLVLWFTSTSIAREFSPEACWPWMLFDLCILISTRLWFAWWYPLQRICKLSEEDQITGGGGYHWWFRAIIADHLADFELGGDGYPMHQPEGSTYVWSESIVSRLGNWAGGGGSHLQGCDYQIEHQPSHPGGVFERDMLPMWEWQVYQPNW